VSSEVAALNFFTLDAVASGVEGSEILDIISRIIFRVADAMPEVG
jgi:hypothetical protein